MQHDTDFYSGANQKKEHHQELLSLINNGELPDATNDGRN